MRETYDSPSWTIFALNKLPVQLIVEPCVVQPVRLLGKENRFISAVLHASHPPLLLIRWVSTYAYVYVYWSPNNVLIICIMNIIKTRSRCKCKRRKKSSWNLLVRKLYNNQDSCQSSKLINYAFCNHALGTIKARHDTSSLDTASCPCTTASQPHA